MGTQKDGRKWGGRTVKACSMLLFLTSGLSTAGWSGVVNASPVPQSRKPSQLQPPAAVKQEPDELRQQLDVDAAALSKIPADPLIRPDPLALTFRPVDRLTDRLAQSMRLKFG